MKLKNFYTCGEPSRLSCVGYFPNRLKLLHFITINFYDKKKKKKKKQKFFFIETPSGNLEVRTVF